MRIGIPAETRAGETRVAATAERTAGSGAGAQRNDGKDERGRRRPRPSGRRQALRRTSP